MRVKGNAFLQAALNGDSVHPATPRDPESIAEAARSAVAAGAHSVHVHAFDENGRETLAARFCAETIRSIRAACPGIPISLTTSAAIEPDPERRLGTIRSWQELPDLVTANQGEAGIVLLCEELLSRGVAIEVGLLSVDDARLFVRSGLAARCRRVLIEPLDLDSDVAVRHAVEMEAIVMSAGIRLEQVHHGNGAACWAVNRRALAKGHGIRTGLEDVTVLPDGTPARDNAELVAAAVALIASQARMSP
uniref:3-keto-5-aminohexanoate cleavage protein n=1 Tax=Mesorhizobium sp. L-8-3 TaxID=2744522 RepID=UPI00192551D3|nr:3-keto-5-aminohexanoate cleavage protein [Mesorhizobium sp. L-8-3]